MHSLFDIIVIAIWALSLACSATAAPINKTELAARDGTHSGWASPFATYYNVEENTGACGWNNHNTEHVVAISSPGPSCGKIATVRYRGKSVRVKVVDACPVCGRDNVDLSPSAFEQLAPKSEGKLQGVTWRID